MIKVTLSNEKVKYQTPDFLYDFQKNVNCAFPNYNINCEFGEIDPPYTIEGDDTNAQIDISMFIEDNSELFFG